MLPYDGPALPARPRCEGDRFAEFDTDWRDMERYKGHRLAGVAANGAIVGWDVVG